jgi:hypothetical protein
MRRPGSDFTPLRSLDERLNAGRHHEFAPDAPPPADAHAKVKRVVELWQALRPGPGLIPGRQHFDPTQARDLLNNIWLLDVVADDPRRYRHRLIGGALTEAGVATRKGEFFGDLSTPEEAARATAVFRRLEQTKQLNWRRGPSALGYLDHVRELERVILPMASDGVTVDLFLCLTVFYDADGREL